METINTKLSIALPEGEPRLVQDYEEEFTFKSVQLFKNETLGTGSYGAVCKAKCDQLICAAKLLYPVLFQMQGPNPNGGNRQLFYRFELECRFLSRINHPNIVQYLGTYCDLETNAPVLLMELMDESLTHFLESSPGDIPYHIQVNLSQDIAQALAFLHANGIIHRDLSSNNVLLIAGSRAKVSDFGMSRFLDTGAMTTCPGTPVFMSPEALNEPSVYTEKLDNFSFGVLVIQVIVREFPKPDDRYEIEKIPNRHDPSHMVEAKLPVPEIKRRQAHISLIEDTHPLLPIGLSCLRDNAAERPSSQQLCASLDSLKTTDKFIESSLQDILESKNQQIQEKNEQLQAKDDGIQALQEKVAILMRRLQARDDVIQEQKRAIEGKDDEIRSFQHEVDDKEQHLRRLNQQLELSQETITILQRSIIKKRRKMAELRELVLSSSNSLTMSTASAQDQRHQQQLAKHTATNAIDSVTRSALPSSPIEILAGSSAEIGDEAYFKSHVKQEIYKFDFTSKHWYVLPHHPLRKYTIVAFNNVLTTVGGNYENWFGNEKCSRKLYSFVGGKWMTLFPPMRTRRAYPAAVVTLNVLIVAGGVNDTMTLNTVEIWSNDSRSWSFVHSLPFSTVQPSMAVLGDNIYLHQRYTTNKQDPSSLSVLRCSLTKLFCSKQSSVKWDNINSLPVIYCTLISLNDKLLAIGGQTEQGESTAHIYQYSPDTDSWTVAGEMSEARHHCLAAILTDDNLIIAGGDSNDQSTELATSCNQSTELATSSNQSTEIATSI